MKRVNIDIDSYLPNELLTHLRHELADLDSKQQDVRIEECIKYLYLASLRTTKGLMGYIPVTHDIDLVWHHCILQTRSYAKLCNALPGRVFIHHRSDHEGYGNYLDAIGPDAAVNEQLWWLENYCKHFGQFSEEAAPYWFIVSFLKQHLSLPLQDINAIGQGKTVQVAVT